MSDFEKKAKVIGINGSVAIVESKRESACDTCRNKGTGCSGCASSESVRVQTAVKNSLGAKVGDEVIVGARGGFVLLSAFFFFVFPLILACLGYIIGLLAVEKTSAAYVFAAVLFFAAYVTVYFLQKKLALGCDLKITEIIKESGNFDN